MHCAQTAEDADTISFAYDIPTHLSHLVKIWLTSVICCAHAAIEYNFEKQHIRK